MKRPDQVEGLGSRCRNEHGPPRSGLNWLPIIEGRTRHRTNQSPWALCCYRRNYWWLRRELNSRKDHRQPRAQSQRPIRTSPLSSVALFRSLRLFVHSWHLGSRTSDESFHNINSALIIFSSAMGLCLHDLAAVHLVHTRRADFYSQKIECLPGYLARKFNSQVLAAERAEEKPD